MSQFINQPCQYNGDCGLSAFLTCQNHDLTQQGQCLHKPLFPIQPIEVGGTVVLCILMALSVMTGIGGGGINVPLLMAFYKLSTKEAIAVSGFAILIGSITRFATTFKDRHPEKDATCIEYGITNVMLPMVLIGSISGVFFNIIFPDVIIQASLTLVLAFLSVQTVIKARKIYLKDLENAKNDANSEPEKPRLDQVIADYIDEPIEGGEIIDEPLEGGKSESCMNLPSSNV